jgi:acetyl-CoA carboxylase biotin carboxyl carrier protein
LTTESRLIGFAPISDPVNSRVDLRHLLFYLSAWTLISVSRSLLFNPEPFVDLKDIKSIIDLMKKNSISEFELEKESFKIRLRRGHEGGVQMLPDDYVMPAIAPAHVLPAAAPAAPAAPTGVDIKSPMIGTFYRAPSPESSSYVEVGTEVEPDTVVCIIEAMKVMNEIKAEVRGVITQACVDNAKPVEFNQPLFKVNPHWSIRVQNLVRLQILFRHVW